MKLTKQLLTRTGIATGALSLALVGVAPAVASAQSMPAQGNQWMNPSSNNWNAGSWNMNGSQGKDQAMAAISKYESNYKSSSAWFRAGIDSDLNMTYKKVGQNHAAGLYKFYDHMQWSDKMLDSKMKAATDHLRTNVNKGMKSDQARNQFVKEVSDAKAWYFNDLDMAKNQLATYLNSVGEAPAKDAFMNSFNSWRDQYGNKLEQAKNDLVAKLNW